MESKKRCLIHNCRLNTASWNSGNPRQIAYDANGNMTQLNSKVFTYNCRGRMISATVAFSSIPTIGPAVLAFGLFTFVFSTLLGWSYYGEEAVEYLFGLKAVRPYRWLWVVCVMVGSVASLGLVWTFADIVNALMAVPNLISLIVLTPVVISETRRYLG